MNLVLPPAFIRNVTQAFPSGADWLRCLPDLLAAAARPGAAAISQRRLDILAKRLNLDRQRLWAWAVCHGLLSAWWDLDEDGTGGEYAACGELLLELES